MATPIRHALALLLVFTAFVAGPVHSAWAQAEKPGVNQKSSEKAAKDLLRLLESRISTEPFQNEMPLSEFLTTLEKQFPKGTKLSLRIDAEAFGKQLTEIAATPCRLPPFPRRMAASTMLDFAMDRLNVPADLRVEGSTLVITTPARALYTVTYDLRDLAPQEAFLRQQLALTGMMLKHDLDTIPPGDVAALAVPLIGNLRLPENWRPGGVYPGFIKVVNGNRLVIHSNLKTHEDVEGTMRMLHRLLDLSVVMTAQLYEVDRAFYARHIEPLLAVPGQPPSKRLVVPIDDALVDRLSQQQVIRQAEDVKVPLYQPTTFFALHDVRAYRAPRREAAKDPGQKGNPFSVGWPPDLEPTKTVLDGVSFLADASVSADRRRVYFKITRRISDVREIKKFKVTDLATGAEQIIEKPDLKTSSVSAKIDVDDGQALLMPVDYRGREARAKDRYWVLLVEPMIYIEEEQEQIKKGQLPPAEPAPKLPAESPAKAPPRTAEVKQVLGALVHDILTNPELKGARDSYGTPGDGRFALTDSSHAAWPGWFHPSIAGHLLTKGNGDRNDDRKQRLLGIRIDEFSLDQKDRGPEDGPIQVVILNVGGNANGRAPLGALRAYYTSKREGKRWIVQLNALISH